MPQRPRTEANRKTNVAVARAVPVFLFAIIGYGSWVITHLVCIDYLRLNGSAIAILVTYYLLLTVLVVSYGRLLYAVIRRPGLIPHGPQWYVEKVRTSKKTKRQEKSSHFKDDESSDLAKLPLPRKQALAADERLPFRVEDFWQKDVFVCQPDGRPPFCSHCHNWKPDRAHHCSELNRCVAKMDHLCPWVGGVVGETSFKHFMQFTFYAAAFCAEALIVVTYYFAQRRKVTPGFLDAHWVVTIALTGLFLIFSGGMFLSSCQFALLNITTIENLDRKTKVWHLAIYVSLDVLEEARQKRIDLRLISYPRPAEEQPHLQERDQQGGMQDSDHTMDGSTAQGPNHQRWFVILESEPGENPFHLGNLENFQELMGFTIWDWLNPFAPSPCAQHNDPHSLYKLGPVVDEMKARTGLEAWRLSESDGRPRRRRRRRRHQGHGESTRHQK